MKFRIVLFAAGLALILLPADADSTRMFTDAQWIEDIDLFAELLEETHINPYHATPEEVFSQSVEDLKSRVPDLSDFAIMMELRHLASLVGDGHTWIEPGKAFAPGRLPIRLEDLADGIFIADGMDAASMYSGTSLETIGGVAVTELVERASRFVSSDNAWGRRHRSVRLLNDEAFLRSGNLMNSDGTVELTISRNGGEHQTIRMELVQRELFNRWIDDATNFVTADAPLYRSRIGETYWMHYLPEENAVYVQFNAVANKKDGPHFVGFGKEMMAFVEEKQAQKLVIDLRHNGGGNGALLDPTVRRISENARINREGSLFVLTSPKTFSAALMFTVRMERNTNALFAGTPGGGKPNSYGEFNAITLPNSGMTGSISSRWHEEGMPDDARDHVAVDIEVQPTSAEYFGNRDPVLEAVLAYPRNAR